jgi:hypothetical protein
MLTRGVVAAGFALLAPLSWSIQALGGRAEESLPHTISFNRDIRPILSDNCFTCHGPDKGQRKAKLRLDIEKEALADRGGYYAILAGRPEKSEIIARLTTHSEKERMPPAKTGARLSPRQIELIRRWIAQGAKWEKHWSFIAPLRPALPEVKNRRWPKNAIDHFVLARLEGTDLAPSEEADRTTLIRRVTLDLTGLPPTPGEVDAFLADTSPDAYEKVVDRLLRSPRYGERMARPWLDAARYADTNGYQTDGERTMWRWRDWVIDAFNRNMPFDQFTVEQIAGDMLPHPTLEQKIATGFNRNHRGNSEGGVIPEEYAVEYVVDRVDTTFTVWLGLTMGCGKCHDHKYDPISQKDFYRVFAYFNNVPEKGKAIKYGNSPPYIKAPTREQQVQLGKLKTERRDAAKRCADLLPALASAQRDWEQTLDIRQSIPWTLTTGLVAHYDLDGDTGDECNPKQTGKFQEGEPAFVAGKIGQAARFDGKRFIDAGDVAEFGFFDRFTLAAWIYPTGPKGGTILSRMVDEPQANGYYLVLQDGKLHVNLIMRWLDDAIRVETEQALAPERWHHVLVTYDRSRVANGIKVYINGRLEKLKINLDDINQSFKTKEPFRIGRGGGPGSGFHGLIDDVRVYDHVLSPADAGLVATTEPINAIVALPPDRRSSHQDYKLRSYFLDKQALPHIQRAHRRLVDLEKQYEKLDDSIPTTMVMEEMTTPRETHVLIRGEYDKKGSRVFPGLPASLPPLPPEVPNNRLGFARWLVHPSNPLTARVAVNRYWQMYFGQGLVKTVEDFGAQGDWPSHPELLDWLATEFIRTGWNIKAMQRLIVTSAAYRQASKVTPELLHKDPENRLLTRGPRFRLSAEVVRDQALFVSGLLVEKPGGPSVKPYQPKGLWKELAGESYEQDKGEKLYRRSLYTFWKRTIPPPAMMTFDAAGRETCIVRQTRTNTPLQALNLMNDVTYVEAARVLAQRIMKEGGHTPEDRLMWGFRVATARRPSKAELTILSDGFQHHLEKYRSDRQAALKLVSAGEAPRDSRLEVGELAAYTAVAGLILNLDEAITRE